MTQAQVRRAAVLTSREREQSWYRAHLDGLRTISVYLVVAFHVGLQEFRGGFIGVDVFFVLSGFLVTSILLRDLATTGQIDLLRFYARRVRRILPAALLTLVGSALAYAAISTPAEMLDVVGGFRAACLYVANWFFIHQSVDYFAVTTNGNPVVHFWSLAVEEQFYLVWPLLLGVLFVSTRRAGRWRWWMLRVVVVCGAIASALAAWLLGRTHLERAYFGTDTRAYQLLAGALLALSPQLFRRGHADRRAAAWRAAAPVILGVLVLIATSSVDVSPITRGFLATVLVAMLIVVLENARGGFVKRALSSPSLTYLGRLSYGTYLWHWPVAVVLTYDRRVSPWVLFVITCVIATGLAALSFHLVERPTRGSRLLDRYRVPVIASGLGISLVVGILVVPAVLERHHGAADLLGSGKGSELLDWKVARNDGVSAPDCLDAPLRRCTIVNGTKKRVLLIGDSYAQMWIPALRKVATTESMTLAVATLAGCPWQRGLFYTDLGAFTDVAASIYRRCKREQPDWYERIVPQFKPDIVILAHPPYGAPNYPLPLTFPDGRKLKYGAPGFERELEDVSAATLRSLRAPGRDIVIIEPIPELAPFNPINCLSRGGPVSRCEHEVQTEPTSLERYFRNESHPPAMSTLDLDNFVCPRLPICDPIVDNVIVRHDGNGHLTATFARAAAPRIATLLRKAGLLSGP